MTVETPGPDVLPTVGHLRHLAPRDVAKGDAGDGVYVVLSGRCSVTGADEHMHPIEPGQFFGEFAGLGGGPRTATVTAEEPSEVLLIVPEQLRQSAAASDLLWTWLHDVATRGRGIQQHQQQPIEDKGARHTVQRMRLPSLELVHKVALTLLRDGLEGDVDGGSGDELTLNANEAAWRELQLLPHVLTGVAERDITVEVLGQQLPHPLIVAPTGFQRLTHPHAEVACARGAAAAGATFCHSTFATTSAADLAAAVPGLRWWFHLYWFTDRDLNWALVDNAVAAGAQAIVLTVDLATLASRERDRHTGFSLRGSMVVPCVADTGLHPTSKLAPPWNMLDPGLCWHDLAELVERSAVPVIVKGLVRADDAVTAVEHGAAAVVVSNHGGRQLDTAVTTARALPAIVDAIGDRADVLVDGGIDIAKALALGAGADAVLVGRPPLWGLAAGGAEGVQHVIELLTTEFDNALALLGVTSARQLERDLLTSAACARPHRDTEGSA